MSGVCTHPAVLRQKNGVCWDCDQQVGHTVRDGMEEQDMTIACAEDTDPDLTHDDCDGTWRSNDWGNRPVKQINGICSCTCHAEGGNQ